MPDEQTPPSTNGNGNGDSQLFGVSVRGWLAVEIVTAVVVLSLMQIIVQEPLYTLAALSVGFYFGNAKK